MNNNKKAKDIERLKKLNEKIASSRLKDLQDIQEEEIGFPNDRDLKRQLGCG
jgi:hypothetical protein